MCPHSTVKLGYFGYTHAHVNTDAEGIDEEHWFRVWTIPGPRASMRNLGVGCGPYQGIDEEHWFRVWTIPGHR